MAGRPLLFASDGKTPIAFEPIPAAREHIQQELLIEFFGWLSGLAAPSFAHPVGKIQTEMALEAIITAVGREALQAAARERWGHMLVFNEAVPDGDEGPDA